MTTPEPTSARREREADEHALLPRRGDGKPSKCLVVEDEGLIAIDIAARLEEWGAESEIAPTVGAALRLLADMRPDVVLLDVRLPDGDGIELARTVRVLSHAKIIFVTAIATTGTLRRVRFVGDFDVVPKPIDYRRLRQALRHALTGQLSSRL